MRLNIHENWLLLDILTKQQQQQQTISTTTTVKSRKQNNWKKLFPLCDGKVLTMIAKSPIMVYCF